MNKILKNHNDFFNTGKTKDIDFRISQLKILKKSIEKYENEILNALYKDLHKCEFESYSTEIGITLSSIDYMIKNLKKWSKPKKVKTPIHQYKSKSYFMWEPYGTVLIIGPFNYPFQLIIEPLIGAIAAGNCVVIKPSENSPNVSSVIKKIICENFNEDYIRVLEGGIEVTSALINSHFDYMFFTGSASIGKIVMEAASKNLVPVTLELGGKSPTIVDKSANLNIAARRIIWGKLINCGQTCVAPDYIIVHKSVKKNLICKMKDVIMEFYGENAIESLDYGRVINEKHFDRLFSIIQRDKDKIIYGGKVDKDSLYIEPTLIDNVNWKDASMEDEIFGPILPIMEYENLDEVINMIISKPKPLALYIFTEDKSVEKKVLENISFGGGCVNDTVSHVANPYMPFGGVGNSGLGGGYHGRDSFELFSHRKSILKKSTFINLKTAFPPYKNKINLVRKILK